MSNPSVVSSKEEPFDNPLYMFDSHCNWLVNQIKSNLLGNVLTVIDSAISDKMQNKATKDLIKQAAWKEEFYSDEFKEIIRQFVEKYCSDMKPFLEELKTPERAVTSRTFFK